jgi:hypothetical protein
VVDANVQYRCACVCWMGVGGEEGEERVSGCCFGAVSVGAGLAVRPSHPAPLQPPVLEAYLWDCLLVVGCRQRLSLATQHSSSDIVLTKRAVRLCCCCLLPAAVAVVVRHTGWATWMRSSWRMVCSTPLHTWAS